MAGPEAKKKGGMMSEEAVQAQAVGYIRGRLSIAAIEAKSLSLLGRLEVMGPGRAGAVGRRRAAEEQEFLSARER